MLEEKEMMDQQKIREIIVQMYVGHDCTGQCDECLLDHTCLEDCDECSLCGWFNGDCVECHKASDEAVVWIDELWKD